MTKQKGTPKKRYYQNKHIQFNLIKAMKNREIVFMDRVDNWKTIRGFFFSHTRFLNYILDNYNLGGEKSFFYESDYNIFVSVAKYKQIPKFTLNLKHRSTETAIWFHNQAKNEIYEYDLLLDFDLIEDKNKLNLEVSKFIFVLMRYEICFNVYPSGSGWQINIPSEVINNISKSNKWYYIKQLTSKIKNRFELEHLDLKGIGNYNKIRKCEYSLNDNLVCFPIINPTINNIIKTFDTSILTSGEILKNPYLLNRGLGYYNKSASQELKQKRFDKFVKLFFLD